MDGMEGAVLDSPVEVTESPSEAIEQPIDGVPGQELTPEPADEGQITDGDGRTLPKEVQSALKLLREQHPEMAKTLEELRKAYFSSRQHGEFFKTPAEARQAHATLELVGGSEGIANLQSQVSAAEAIDAAAESGDPSLVEDWASDFPEGFKKLAAPYLDKLQKLDPVAYAKTLQPHVYASLESAGLGSVLSSMQQALAANDVAQVKDILGKTLGWLDGQKQLAGQRPKTDDPERLKFEQDKQAFNQEKEKTFRGDIGRETSAHQSQVISKSLTPYLKTRNLSIEAKSDLNDGINREINRLLKADSVYQSQVKAMLNAKNRDAGKIRQYISAALDEVGPKATKAVWGRRYGTSPATRTAPTPTDKTQAAPTPASGGPVRIAAKPNRDDIEKGRGWDTLLIANKAVMAKGPYKGRMVTWK